MKETITAWVIEPGREPEQREIRNELEEFQRLVGGYIEPIFPYEEMEDDGKDVVMFCNEEGKLNGLEPNFSYHGDMIVGTVVIVGTEGEDITDCPLNEDELKAMLPWIWAWED